VVHVVDHRHLVGHELLNRDPLLAPAVGGVLAAQAIAPQARTLAAAPVSCRGVPAIDELQVRHRRSVPALQLGTEPAGVRPCAAVVPSGCRVRWRFMTLQGKNQATLG
jgi:hypothetical protein